jgi:NAD(P)-dependent dehydrogenase (short-subunit alcohol dehydrogenase family)
MGLAGRTAVGTGGASGIGRAIALRLARDGAAVAVLDRDAEGAARVAAEIDAIGPRAVAVTVDVADTADVDRAVEHVHAGLGCAHVLVTAAGIAEFCPTVQLTDERWERMIAVHLGGTFKAIRAFAPDMIAEGWGRIIAIASVAGLIGGPGLSHYSAAKAGIIALAKSVARELGPAGVTANAIAPGLVDTPLLRASQVPDAIFSRAVEMSPVRRMGTPDDIAAAAAFLASPEAGWFTGQVMSPNGGAHV